MVKRLGYASRLPIQAELSCLVGCEWHSMIKQYQSSQSWVSVGQGCPRYGLQMHMAAQMQYGFCKMNESVVLWLVCVLLLRSSWVSLYDDESK